MAGAPKYSLVVPCYNEEKNIPLVLERFTELAERKGDLEVIIVDNGSTDNTPNVLKDLLGQYPFARMIRVELNRGYGYGIISGLAAATGEILGWTHADIQTDPMDFMEAFRLCEKQEKPQQCFLKGKRFGRSSGDRFFTLGMSIFETLLLGYPLWDINAQPNLFGRSFWQALKDAPYDFSLDLFIYYMAKRKGLKILRFPVQFKRRIHGTSHWNVNGKAKIKFIKRTMEYSMHLRKRFQDEAKIHCPSS